MTWTGLYLNKETSLNYCHHCGADLSALSGPAFCNSCGKSLTTKVATAKDWSHWDEVLDEAVDPWTAVDRFMSRFWAGSSAMDVGVIVRTAAPIEASLALHDEALMTRLDSWSKDSSEPIPGNCCLHPINTGRLWRDAAGRLVPRAAAVAYYIFGVGLSRKWHIHTPLQAMNRHGMVTVDQNRMDFCLRYRDDMDKEKFEDRLLASLKQLATALATGITTNSVKIHPCSQMASVVLFLVKNDA